MSLDAVLPKITASSVSKTESLAKNFFKHSAELLQKENHERKKRLRCLTTVQEEAGRKPVFSPRGAPVFRPPSPTNLPPAPHQKGAPVRVFSQKEIQELEEGLRTHFLDASGEENDAQEVVLEALRGRGGEHNKNAQGELARHGHWYKYECSDYEIDNLIDRNPALRPKRMQNIKAIYITGDATTLDLASLASCLLAKPPRLMDKPKALPPELLAEEIFRRGAPDIHAQTCGDEDEAVTEAWSASDFLRNGPGYGPYTLFLHNAVVDANMLEALANVLRSNPLVDGMCTLNTLIFCNNSLKSVKEEALKTLFDSFKKNYRLTLIRFSSNQIDDRTASRLFSATAGCVALETLDLSDNVIGDAGMENVAALLIDATNLKALVLENNRVSDTGILHICRGACISHLYYFTYLPSFPPSVRIAELLPLMLMPCAIGLVRNSSLKELNLNGNRYAVLRHLTAIVPMFSVGPSISLTG